MTEVLELAGLVQEKGGLLLMMVVIWMDMRFLKEKVKDLKNDQKDHVELYVHTERRARP